MPNTEKRAGLWPLLGGLLAGLYLAAPAYAFTPSDSPLLSAAAVPPNVMLLIDNSGSMNNIIYAPGFKPGDPWTPARECDAVRCTLSNSSAITSDMIMLSSLSTTGCSNGYNAFYNNSTTPLCIKLPDPAGDGDTRYSAAYIAYVVGLAKGRNTDFSGANSTIPTGSRMGVARAVSTDLVNSNRTLRIGLATFNGVTNYNPGNGGYIALPIDDLTSDAKARALTNAIGALRAVANTPLAEAYYEVTRYMRGIAPFYNSTPKTYTSPIQYRCQKNYGVVVTDGLPTYDRNFPSDPDAPSSGPTRLPNWDGISNDGQNPLGGDKEGDSLFLDDIAKFAFDIDMRHLGVDLAKQNWDSPDFPKQNMNTYTVGFAVANKMLEDAARYGQGKYYQATDSAELTEALSSALSEITSKAGSGGSGTTNGAIVDTGTAYYQTSYDPKDWRGTIKSFGFTTTGSVDTASVLWTTDKTIVPSATAPIYQSFNTQSNTVVPLAFGNFSPQQQTLLTQGLPVGISGVDLVEWSKGATRAGLKLRTALLGDIINSPLVLASANDQTAADLPGSTTYTEYLARKSASMTPSLVVNANDGFVNVINANDGTRRYAYMPSSVLPSLRYIAEPTYIDGVSHKFLVDGQVGVFDAQVTGAWKTLAIGGTGAGGKTFYALQLFGASAGNTPNALWEISAPATPNPTNVFNDLGYAYARPEVARLPDGRWAAFISNGYGSSSGVAALFVVDIKDGSLIKKIVVNSADPGNGLSSVKLRVNSQNVVQAAYGGDLKGRMWKFDLSGEVDAWRVAFAGNPLFTAAGNGTQPITVQPLLADHPLGGKVVFFGTGKFNETADKSNKDLQALYAVWDAEGGSGQITAANLQIQSVTGVFSGSAGQFITSSQNETTFPAKKGWYLPLVYNSALTGERVINPANMVLGRIIFTTASVDTTDPCASFGTGNLVEVDAFTGKMLNYAVLDTNNDGVVDGTDRISSGVVFSGGIPTLNAIINGAARKVVNDSSGTITTLVEKSGGGSRRIMWRQIQ